MTPNSCIYMWWFMSLPWRGSLKELLTSTLILYDLVWPYHFFPTFLQLSRIHKLANVKSFQLLHYLTRAGYSLFILMLRSWRSPKSWFKVFGHLLWTYDNCNNFCCFQKHLHSWQFIACCFRYCDSCALPTSPLTPNCTTGIGPSPKQYVLRPLFGLCGHINVILLWALLELRGDLAHLSWTSPRHFWIRFEFSVFKRILAHFRLSPTQSFWILAEWKNGTENDAIISVLSCRIRITYVPPPPHRKNPRNVPKWGRHLGKREMGAVAWRIRKKWNDACMLMVQKSAKNEINGVGCMSMISSFVSYMPLGIEAFPSFCKKNISPNMQ